MPSAPHQPKTIKARFGLVLLALCTIFSSGTPPSYFSTIPSVPQKEIAQDAQVLEAFIALRFLTNQFPFIVV